MYQDSGCNSSSSRRGSSSAATTAAAATAATAAAAAAPAGATAATSSSDEDTLETLTIITTTITETEIHAAATTATTTTTTVIAGGGGGGGGGTSTVATGGGSGGLTTGGEAAAAAVGTSDIEDSSPVESDSEECEYVEIQEGSSISSSTSGHAALQRSGHQEHQHHQHQQHQHQQLQLQLQQADVRLLRKIGYIASRVRCLSKFYGDFRLVNPYSARRQRRQLQEILLRHSIFDPGKEHQRAIVLAAATAAIAGPTQAAIAAGADCVSSGSNNSIEAVSSSELEEPEPEAEEEEQQQQQQEPGAPVIAVTTTSTTVRRKSSSSSTLSGTATVSGSVSVSASASQSFCSNSPIALLEELLIQFYEEQEQQQQQQHRSAATLIRPSCSRQLTANNNNNNNNNNINNNCNSIQNNNNMSTSMSNMASTAGVATSDPAPSASAAASGSGSGSIASTVTATLPPPPLGSGTQQQQQQHLALALTAPDGSDNPRRRRASDCSAVQAALQNQLHCITLKNNNCASSKAMPFHRGSCGAAGEHLLAANSIANRATIILSKSCSNVDGDVSGGLGGVGGTGGGGLGKLRASATDIESNALNGARDAMATIAAAAAASNNGNGNGNGNGNNGNNGNNEYSILQLNNTIIQCHFNDDDFRALVKDLKRKVEYTERMNWLCLSKRPLGPPHRKSSLPKHQEVKRRFLEICDTTFSEEVRAALRLPAFDSYEWGDADVIHLMQTMFVELGFIEKFSIPVDTLREWLYEVYKHYNEVPFHNFRHCFCVAQMMYAITRQANLLSRLGDLECLILLVSCICHDLDHPGYNNIYQINARTELALRYNDISPLENHHCSIAFRLLEHPECNIFKNFSRDTFNTIREGIIRCILATDMARHNEILTQFMEITPVFDYSNRAHINLLCMILIKVADISNEARPMDVAEPWLDRLLQEFFAQSAAEKSEGLPVTPFMDPDKVSKPGSQVRFIGLVLLPLFEALGELVPELTDLIIIPVRIALEYYRRLNDAQTKTRKSVADSNTSATSDSNSGTIDSNAAMVSTPGGASDKLSLDKAQGNSQGSGGGGGGGGGAAGSGGGGGGGSNAAGSVSPQMPRSGSGISVKSRRSIPSQKSASRTSVDEPGGMAAELHDLPEGSESGDSETATEVDVAEKTSKFKVDTEGSSNRSKSSHSTSRKSSREKRPSMIGELCSSGGGQRIRNSYGNIHGYHSNRCHFGNNRAVSLDQYSSGGNNRRLSDGLPQVISDSNVFYGRHNRSSGLAEATAGGAGGGGGGGGACVVVGIPQDTNANTNVHRRGSCQLKELLARTEAAESENEDAPEATKDTIVKMATVPVLASSSNGNISPPMPPQPPVVVTEQILPSNGSTRSSASSARGGGARGEAVGMPGPSSGSSSWKSRLRQFSDYFSFSFDKGNKRFGSTRSSPCSGSGSSPGRANNNANGLGDVVGQDQGKSGVVMCCNVVHGSPAKTGGAASAVEVLAPQGGGGGGGGDSHQRHRAYSLDVPGMMRYSSSDSSRHPSSNTLQSGGGLTGTEANVGGVQLVPPSLSVEMGLASGSSSEAGPKI